MVHLVDAKDLWVPTMKPGKKMAMRPLPQQNQHDVMVRCSKEEKGLTPE
jgi:hypothetical protein